MHTHPAGTNPWGELIDSEDESSGKGSGKKKDGASGSGSGSGSGEPQLETYTYDVRYILGKSDTNVSELEINNMADTASGDGGGRSRSRADSHVSEDGGGSGGGSVGGGVGGGGGGGDSGPRVTLAEAVKRRRRDGAADADSPRRGGAISPRSSSPRKGKGAADDQDDVNGWDEMSEVDAAEQAQQWLADLDRIHLKSPIRQFLAGKRGALTLNAVKSKGLTVGDFRAEAHTYAQSQNVSTTAGAFDGDEGGGGGGSGEGEPSSGTSVAAYHYTASDVAKNEKLFWKGGLSSHDINIHITLHYIASHHTTSHRVIRDAMARHDTARHEIALH